VVDFSKGDLVIVVEPFPKWKWMNYTTGDIGIIIEMRDYQYGFRIARVFFLKTSNVESVPDHFLLRIEDGER